jgi:hypothetical protein
VTTLKFDFLIFAFTRSAVRQVLVFLVSAIQRDFAAGP